MNGFPWQAANSSMLPEKTKERLLALDRKIAVK